MTVAVPAVSVQNDYICYEYRVSGLVQQQLCGVARYVANGA